MIKVYDADIIAQTGYVLTALAHSKLGTITGEGFQRKALPYFEEKVNRKYPYTVKIPKSIDLMLGGDFSPAKEITITEPIEGPYSHMWFGDATSGIKLMCGYINGDSRYIFDTELGDAIVHGIMVGATGQGKSVTLNAIIYNACTLYAPWELHLTLSDAKIVEFKSIAQNNPMPQIETVAATGDVYYLLSVLEQKIDEMNKLNSVFTKAAETYGEPCKKIAEFRKITGLSLPQNVLIFDEFQTMFTKAGKLSKRITEALDAFARLGRNTGYHLLLTSQELGSELPKETLKNITFRGAMGCAPDVSEMILGNAAAAQNMGRKGKMIVNLNSMSKDREEKDTSKDNINVSVPYIDPQTGHIAEVNIAKGKELGVTPRLQFYDEFNVERISDFSDAIKKLPCDKSKIYLGEPSFVSDSPYKRLVLTLDQKEQNNIVVVSPIQSDLMRHFEMLKANTLLHKEITNIVQCLNDSFIEHGAKDLNKNLFFDDRAFETSKAIAAARSITFRRMLCLKADKIAFESAISDADLEESNKVFDMIVESGSDLDNHINRVRLYLMKNLMITDPIFVKGFGEPSDEQRLQIFKACLQMFAMYESKDSCLTLDLIPDLQVWLLGADNMLGLGVDPKAKFMNQFKDLLIYSGETHVRYTLFCNTIAEFQDINTLVHWYIFDHPITSDLSKAKVQETYPEQISGVLAVICDKKQPKTGCLKFKKLFYDGEIPSV